MRFEVQACIAEGGTVYVAIFENYVNRGIPEERQSLDLTVTKAFDSLSELEAALGVLGRSSKLWDFSEARQHLADEIHSFQLERGWSAWDCGRVTVFYKNRGNMPFWFGSPDMPRPEV